MKTKRAGGESNPRPLKLFFVRDSVKHTRAFKSVVEQLLHDLRHDGLQLRGRHADEIATHFNACERARLVDRVHERNYGE